jgi:tetratricopeptide (TPR) repeat protein
LFCAGNVVFNEIILGNLRSAEEQLASIQPLLEEVGDPGGPAELNIKSSKAALLRYQGKLDKAERSYRQLREKAQAVGDPQSLSGIDFNLGGLLLEIDEVEEAETVLLEALDLFDRLESFGRVAIRSLLSMNQTRHGRFKEAHRWLDEARQSETELGEGFIDTAWRLMAERRLAVAERDWPQAWARFEAFMERAEKAGFRWFRAQALREWAEAHLARAEPGDEEKAREMLLESKAEFEAMGAQYYADQVREILRGLD